MNPRNTGILVLLAGALAAYVYFFEIGGEGARKQVEDDAKRLFPGVEVASVEFVELTTSDGRSARLERRDGIFTLVSPFEFPADAFAADALASGLANLRSERKLESPQSPEVYGLAAGASQHSFGAGGEGQGIRVGKLAPVGGDTYVSVLGSDAVYLVKSFSVKALEKTLDDLRRKRVAPFDRDSIDQIEMRWRDSSALIERGPDGWSLQEPLRGSADPQAVDKLLSDLSFLRAEGFLDDPTPQDEAGLAEPDLSVHLRGNSDAEGEEPVEIQLAFGPADDAGSRLVRAGLPSLFRVSASSFDSLPAELLQLRFRTLAEFDPFDAGRLEIVFEGPEKVTINAVRNDAGWTSEPEPIDPESLEALVEQLAGLKAASILAETMGPSELHALGLDPPRVAYRVFGIDPASPESRAAGAGALLGEVHLGSVRGEDGRIVAQAAGSPIVYALEAAFAEAVPVSLDALRDRFVIPPDAAITSEAATETDSY